MRRIAAIVLIGVLVWCLPAVGADSGTSATTTKPKAGYHCLFIGHSFFIPVAKRFEKLPGQCGVENHRQQVVFSGGRSGSPGELWKGGRRATIQKILETGKIELLGMTYYNSENSSSEAYKRWIDYALKYNPKTVFFIGLPWGKDGAKRKLAEYAGANQRASAALYRTVVELRKKYPNNAIFYANYGMASGELKRLFEAGKLPDVKNMVGKSGGTLYTDSMGHAANILKDLSALVWLRALYDVDLASGRLKLDYATDLRPIAVKIVAEQTGRQQETD
jgi:hypothetical protein